MLQEPWRIDLLGGLRAAQGGRVITRFRTQKTGALLAYLAYYLNRAHPREELTELFWPEDDPAAARNSLRVALNSLRHQLEPPGVPSGAVLVADRVNVQLNPAAVKTDTAEFEAALHAAMQAANDAERLPFLQKMVELYRGALLPGYYDTWIALEQDRLAEAYLGALRQIIKRLAQERDYDGALEYARRAVRVDPLREESHRNLMRLYAAVGRPAAALEQYRELKTLLQKELGGAPSAATRQLAEQLSRIGERAAGERTGAQDIAERKAELARRIESVPVTVEPEPPQTTIPSFLHPPIPSPVPRLPLQFTRFFGREEEAARLTELLSRRSRVESRKQPDSRLSTLDSRLITLTGPGGIGKTRLAIEAAGRLAETFGGAVWFVPLADLTDPRLIVGAIQAALRLPPSPNVEPLEQVVAALSQQPSLLVLDNFEHLAAGGALVLMTLLKRIPALTCLVTSRQRLAVAGEREFPLRPLPTPEKAFRRSGIQVFEEEPERLMQFPTVQLFVDRAQAVRPDFQVTPGNAGAVAALCARLEGIPLAIELAAARAQVLTPAQMLERLSQRFDLLASRRTDKDSRHRSLWAAIDWSYHLLSSELQRFFARLSVFRGGWTLERAEAVCEEPRALDYLAQLRGHSLITAEEGAPEMRFRLLESLREFAADQLSPEEQTALAYRHAGYFLSLAEEADSKLNGPEQAKWLDMLEAEHDNLRAALNFRLAPDDNQIENQTSKIENIDAGLRLAAALRRFWTVRGYLNEGRAWLERALSWPQAQEPTEARAKALNGAGTLAYLQGDYAEARLLYEASLEIGRRLGKRESIAGTLNNLGLLLWNQGNYTAARAYQEESLAIKRELGDRWGIASSLLNLGAVCRDQGEEEKARALFEESLAICRELGDQQGTSHALHNMGNLALAARDYARARALYEESLTIKRALGYMQGVATTLDNLGEIARYQEDYDAARAFYEESMAIMQELGSKSGIATSLSNLGAVAVLQGDYARARTLLEESLTMRRTMGDQPGIAACLEGFACLATAQAKSKIQNPESKITRTVRLAGAATALRETIGATLTLLERTDLDRAIAAARAVLGEEAFEAAWTQGRALTPEQAIEEAFGKEEQP